MHRLIHKSFWVGALTLALAVLVWSPASLWAQGLGATTAPLRLMTYNIRIDVKGDNPPWAERRLPMANQIAFYAPDILGVQEARPDAVAYLSEQLPDYGHYGLGRDDGALDGETTTLFYLKSRFEVILTRTQWCSQTPEKPSLGWDAAYKRTVTEIVLKDRYSQKILDIRNAHFDHMGTVAQLECARLIKKWPPYRHKGREALLFVMGDFNVKPETQAYQTMITQDEHPLKDTRLDAKISFGPHGTFNGFDLATKTDHRIDYIFAPKSMVVTRFGVLTDHIQGRVISDHFPVLTEVLVPMAAKISKRRSQ